MKNNIGPTHILRLYMWEMLQHNELLQKINDYIPIVPLRDEPNFQASGMPYIIYGYSEFPSTGVGEIRSGVMALRISARTFNEAGEITTTISRAFENDDRTAANINAWSDDYEVNGEHPFRGIRLTNLKVSYIETGEAPETEGQTYESIVNISYSYIPFGHKVIEYSYITKTWE